MQELGRDDGALQPAVPRLDMVDLLRGLSIVAVVLLHILIFSYFHVRLGRDWPPLTRHFVFLNGENGVTVFFAVSGFLITLTSMRRFGSLAALRPWIFYRIRFARIMPLLLLLLAVLSVLHLAHVKGYRIDTNVFTLPRALLSVLTFHLNWLEAARNAYLPPCWTVLWSLSIEEMFYLFFPLACLLWRLGRWGAFVWFALGLALVVLGPFARTVWGHTSLERENAYLGGMSTIALGCMTAQATERAARRGLPRRGALWAAQIAGWAAILLVAIGPHWPLLKRLGASGLDDTLLAVGACLVMFATTLRGVRGTRWSAPLRWLGRHSYEVYLWHEFVVLTGVGLFARLYPQATPRAAETALIVSILATAALLGGLLARFFSEPMNRKLRGAGPAQ
jgi:peptidoglycan/LPS O-acetylase OafA/YrhL